MHLDSKRTHRDDIFVLVIIVLSDKKNLIIASYWNLGIWIKFQLIPRNTLMVWYFESIFIIINNDLQNSSFVYGNV